MKQHHLIFNVIGVTFALLFTISGCGQIEHGGRTNIILWTILVILLVGGGSIMNLCERRLALWPTIVMIIGYALSIFLIPLGIWGIVALAMDQTRRRRKRW